MSSIHQTSQNPSPNRQLISQENLLILSSDEKCSLVESTASGSRLVKVIKKTVESLTEEQQRKSYKIDLQKHGFFIAFKHSQEGYLSTVPAALKRIRFRASDRDGELQIEIIEAIDSLDEDLISSHRKSKKRAVLKLTQKIEVEKIKAIVDGDNNIELALDEDIPAFCKYMNSRNLNIVMFETLDSASSVAFGVINFNAGSSNIEKVMNLTRFQLHRDIKVEIPTEPVEFCKEFVTWTIPAQSIVDVSGKKGALPCTDSELPRIKRDNFF